MKIEKYHIEKADPLLQEALEQAEGDEILRTIMVLGPEADSRDDDPDSDPDPNQFSSRAEYRRSLLDSQQNKLSRSLGGIMRKLEDLPLKLKGGKISPTVVVEGRAREILRSLDLPGVRHASLDRKIELDMSHSRGKK